MKRWPAEWEPQEAILLSFPHRKSDWPYRLKKVEQDFSVLVQKIVETQKVVLLVQNEKHLEYVKILLQKNKANLSSINLVLGRTNRSWMRDTSPLYVYKNKERVGMSFEFKAWAKYQDYNWDARVPNYLEKHSGIPNEKIVYKNQWVSLEGGALDTNGNGTIITTEECLLDPIVQVRNYGFSKKDYEKIFEENLGCQQTLWLEAGVLGDDTHGHIDDVCKFVNETTVVLALENDKKKPNYKITQRNLEILQNTKLANGKSLNIISIPLPETIKYQDEILPASYINFLFGNESVFVPTFRDKKDKDVIGILKELIPNKKIIDIDCYNIILGLGSIHCLSSQIPKKIKV